MPCSLLDLSDELQLKVIDELLYHEATRNKVHSVNLERDDDFQYHHDLMNWSCTSSYFRKLLAPYIFKTVKIRNDERSGAFVDALRRSPNGALIKELYFVGTVLNGEAKLDDDESTEAKRDHEESGEAKGEEGDSSSIAAILPNVVNTLLSDLRQFPNLESLSIGFMFPYKLAFDEYYDVEGIIDHQNPEPSRAWKTLMTKTYEALFRNKIFQFKALEIRKFVWTNTEPFENSNFHELLSHMERFNLSVRGGNNGAGWRVNTCEGYLEVISRLDEYFVDHLKSATSLTIKAPEHGPIGLEGMNHTRLALRKDQMPLLKELHLEYIFICKELVDFLIGHTGTLERLSLHDSACRVHSFEVIEPFYWKQLFDSLHDADLKKLSHLEILPLNPRLTFDEEFKIKEGKGEPKDVQEIRRTLREDANRRLFAYAYRSGKYGMLMLDEDENLAAFQRGEDQAAYDRLRGKLNSTASKDAEL